MTKISTGQLRELQRLDEQMGISARLSRFARLFRPGTPFHEVDDCKRPINLKQIADLLETDDQCGGLGEPFQRFLTKVAICGLREHDLNSALRYNDTADMIMTCWDMGVAEVVGHKSFHSYLKSLPFLAVGKTNILTEKHRWYCLVEPRLTLQRACDLFNVELDPALIAGQPLDDAHAEFSSPAWISISGIRPGDGVGTPVTWREDHPSNELGLTALQGVFAYALGGVSPSESTNGNRGRGYFFPGTVVGDNCACLYAEQGRVKLGAPEWNMGHSAYRIVTRNDAALY
jgi:hypothetical protein